MPSITTFSSSLYFPEGIILFTNIKGSRRMEERAHRKRIWRWKSNRIWRWLFYMSKISQFFHLKINTGNEQEKEVLCYLNIIKICGFTDNFFFFLFLLSRRLKSTLLTLIPQKFYHELLKKSNFPHDLNRTCTKFIYTYRYNKII